MNRSNTDVFLNEKTYRIRSMRSLVVQLKKDYKEMNCLWKKLISGNSKKGDREDFMEKVSWIKAGLKMLKKIEKNKLEGII